MSNKSRRIAELIEPFKGRELDAHYLAYVECFNRQLFFEAHDVLEELWLAQRDGSNYAFHKGLIQLAGAFVHLQNGRLRPAVSVFKLAEANLSPYAPAHDRLDMAEVLQLIRAWRRGIEEARFTTNPLVGDNAPKLKLQGDF